MSEDAMIDVVQFTDEDGNELEMELVDEFEYEGGRYAVLADLDAECEHADCDHADGETCDCEDSLYIVKVETTPDGEDYVPVEDELLEKLVSVVEERLLLEE